jgi:hypothetical protein
MREQLPSASDRMSKDWVYNNIPNQMMLGNFLILKRIFRFAVTDAEALDWQEFF